jgi:hypothetical protein
VTFATRSGFKYGDGMLRRASRLLVFCAWAGSAAAGEPHLTVRATDAATGRPLAGLVCGLVRPGATESYARFEGPAYREGPAPQAGDRLHVFCRGYDAVVHTLADGARTIDVSLAPAAGRGVVRIEGDGVEACVVEFHVRIRADGPTGREPIRASYPVKGRGSRHEFVVPGGVSVAIAVDARPGLVVPLDFRLEPGATRKLQYVAPRVLEVRRADSLRLAAGNIEVLPDLLWKPAAPPAHVDAWRWRLNRPGWLADAIAGTAGKIAVTPDVPFHLFASFQGRGIYRYVTPGTAVLDLGAPGPLRRVTARPVVDGRPAPAEARLLPGRLDLYTASTLSELSVALRGCVVELDPVDAGWTPVALPAAEWLTLWHPVHGIAHLRATAAGAPSGKWQRGRVVLDPAPGHDATGHVSVFPVWRGTGAVTTVPPERPLRRSLHGSKSVEFRGLPPGRYGLRCRFTSVERKTGRAHRVQRTIEFDLPAARPSVRRRLPTR